MSKFAFSNKMSDIGTVGTVYITECLRINLIANCLQVNWGLKF